MKAWKIQKVFEDILYDLRSRGLLPVVGLLLVAMVAVPMLISRGGSDASTSSLQPAAAGVTPAPEGERAVVSYSPGIRNYKKRLNDLSPKDPFRQQFAQSAKTASALSSTVTIPTGGGTTSSTSSSSPAIGSPGPSTGGGSTGSGGKKKHKKKGKSAPPTTTTSYQVDILAGDVDATLTPFANVASMSPLPSQTTPVVIYFGLSSDSGSALFLVSNKVSNQVGPGTCLPSPDDCALLSLAAGQSEDLLYTQDGHIYRIVVAEIKRFTK